jgi:hypothetical protein
MWPVTVTVVPFWTASAFTKASPTVVSPAGVVDLEGDVALGDERLGRPDDADPWPGDLDGRGLPDVVLVALDRDEVAVGEGDDVVGKGRHGRRGRAGRAQPPRPDAPASCKRRWLHDSPSM